MRSLLSEAHRVCSHRYVGPRFKVSQQNMVVSTTTPAVTITKNENCVQLRLQVTRQTEQNTSDTHRWQEGGLSVRAGESGLRLSVLVKAHQSVCQPTSCWWLRERDVGASPDLCRLNIMRLSSCRASCSSSSSPPPRSS